MRAEANRVIDEQAAQLQEAEEQMAELDAQVCESAVPPDRHCKACLRPCMQSEGAHAPVHVVCLVSWESRCPSCWCLADDTSTCVNADRWLPCVLQHGHGLIHDWEVSLASWPHCIDTVPHSKSQPESY